MEFKDYYALLGVEKSTSTEDIKKTYRKLARKYHPDVNPGDQEATRRFAQINEAHEVLSDPERRAKYDRLELSWRTQQQADESDGVVSAEDFRAAHGLSVGHVTVDAGKRAGEPWTTARQEPATCCKCVRRRCAPPRIEPTIADQAGVHSSAISQHPRTANPRRPRRRHYGANLRQQQRDRCPHADAQAQFHGLPG